VKSPKKDRPFSRKTRSVCLECGRLVGAEIYADGRRLLIRRDCPEHGGQTTVFLKDNRFFLATDRWIDRSTERTAPDAFRGTFDHVRVARDLYIDLTERCNFHCPFCYTNANGSPAPDLTREEIFAGVDRLPPGIVVSLLGGEPTLRADLPEIVRHIAERGHVVKLITNGVLLTDELIDRLCEAGLRWVILQFDGFTDDISRRLRGRPLVEKKLETIARLAKRQINIVLASMIVPGVNDGQVGRILHFALCHPQIVQIGFLPVSNIGRNGPEETVDLETSAFIDLLVAQTGGKIRRDDFVRGVREGQIFTRATGNLAYKSRTCCQGLFLFHDGYAEAELSRSASASDVSELHREKTLLPIDRAIASPGRWLRRPRKVARALGTIVDWNRNPVNAHLLGIVIEKFRGKHNLDFDDAKNCTKVYLTRDGFIPNCLYNLLYRPRIRHEC